MFNPNPTIRAVMLHDGRECLVVDDALADPAGWRQWLVSQRDAFAPTRHAYPGVELWLPDDATGCIRDFVACHLAERLGAGEVLEAASRASLVSLDPEALSPRQWFCHRDDRGMAAGERMIASVIYLFDDPALGGTAFYRPRRPEAAVEALVRDATLLRAGPFAARYPDIRPGYMVEGNEWFEQVAVVPARPNRAVFYDGGLFHSGDIREPARMSADPVLGRLTLNGFLRCRRLEGG